jgi:hypothetical protein
VGRPKKDYLKWGVHGWRSGWAREKQNGWSDTMVVRVHIHVSPYLVSRKNTLDGDDYQHMVCTRFIHSWCYLVLFIRSFSEIKLI